MKFIKDKKEGSVFMIPLFLPRREKEDLIGYSAYQFAQGDMYAFGRLIEIDRGGDVVEIFCYTGAIPDQKEAILASGRLCKPLRTFGGFAKKRWRFVFEDEGYEKYRDSDYSNISFLLHSEIWTGGIKHKVSGSEMRELKKLHSDWIIHGTTQVEKKIRDCLAANKVHYDYKRIVAARLPEFPVFKEKDSAFKKKIAPFHWMEHDNRTFSLCLEAGIYKNELFASRLGDGFEGSGYDWAAVAAVFLTERMPECADMVHFDPEADLFSAHSVNQKALQQFALAFKAACEDEATFADLLSRAEVD